MTDATAPRANTPWHFWLVAILALLWNGFGGYDMFMSITQGETYWVASGMSQAQIDYYNAMPNWMYGPWIAGVGGAVLGAIALILRMKLAVLLFFVSLLGALGSAVYGLMNPMPAPPPGMEMMSYMQWVIVAIAVFLWWYASAMSKRGVLR
jgi:hypothetical protein